MVYQYRGLQQVPGSNRAQLIPCRCLSPLHLAMALLPPVSLKVRLLKILLLQCADGMRNNSQFYPTRTITPGE